VIDFRKQWRKVTDESYEPFGMLRPYLRPWDNNSKETPNTKAKKFGGEGSKSSGTEQNWMMAKDTFSKKPIHGFRKILRPGARMAGMRSINAEMSNHSN